MKIQNNVHSLKERMRIVGGNLTGIWDKNTFFIGNSPYPLPRINYITSTLVNVSPLAYKNNFNILYHLSGYGSNSSEARLSFMGESSERYAFAIMPLTLRNDIVRASYAELVSKYGKSHVLPLDYVNIFLNVDEVSTLVSEDRIAWVKTISILDPQRIIFQPLQLVMFNPYTNEKKYNVSAVSTGTASHEDINSAFRNALVEYLQIDSYNLWWYGGHEGEKLKVNVDNVIKKYLQSDYLSFTQKYCVTFTDISFDKGIWVIVCEIYGKNTMPLYTVGLQGGMSLEKAIYRSFMEALTVMAYSVNLSWLKPKLLQGSEENLGQMNNLDENVAYYVMHNKPHLKVNAHHTWVPVNKAKSTEELVNVSRPLLEWAGVINITPHEFDNLNLNVIRICAPKLLPIAMPSYPPVKHPRYKETGGLINHYEHPMA